MEMKQKRGIGFLMTLKIRAEQAIKMNEGEGGNNMGAGEGRVAVSMPMFPEKGKKKLL